VVELVGLLVEVVLLLAACAAFAWWSRGRRLAYRKRVLVNLRDGSAFDGVLWSRTGAYLVLRSAVVIEPGGEPTPVNGDVLVERERVAWVQAPPSVGGR